MNRRNLSWALLAGSIGLPFVNRAFALAIAADAATSSLKLAAVSRTIDVNGRAASVFGLTTPDGKPGLNLIADETVKVDLANTLSEDTMIHWHGLLPKWDHDGVPGMPMPLLSANEVRRYELPTGKPGTHWMHAHTLQEQNLLAAPLIVRSKEEMARDEQDVVVMLHDFSFTPAAELLATLKSGSGMVGMNMQGMDHSKMPSMKMGEMSKMVDKMMGSGMMSMDINDIEYDAYLANDRTLNDPDLVTVEKGGRVRLRIINGATATAFTIDTGALDSEVIAVDGQDIVPFRAAQFPLAMGQRVDLRLAIPKEGGAFPVLALREGGVQRTGIILASQGTAVAKIADAGEATGPVLSLAAEMGLVAAMPLLPKEPERRVTVDLFGNMQDYTWEMQSNAPLTVAEGDRVLVEMRNMSMMTHPMHLHGHHFQIVAVNQQSFAGAVRDTVIVPHMTSVTFAFDAINPGKAWAFHCHHLYHMASGMMAAIGYEGA
jgi:FtsP/CotA-like multicopper oxidase with cupredoxin domain